MKKLFSALLLLFCCLILAACGGVFEKEYVAVSDYVPPVQAESGAGERVTVRNMAELKKTIISMVYDGAVGGSIAFDPNYDGSAPEDMESACWQVRTQDALCAYCVRDMNYEVEKIVNYYEGTISIDYTNYAAELSSIIRLPYSVGLQDILSSAMEENRTRVTILIDTSTTTTENVKTMVQDLYRKNPTLCVREPQLTVNMYSGSGRQRLYEINFRYGMPEDEVIRCKSQLKNLDVMSNLDARELDDPHRALAACQYLVDNCTLSESAQGSCYDALIRAESNSEGLALAYVEMCHQLGIDCRIVYGQFGGANHCWNIVRLDGSCYHVDISRCYDGSFREGFLLNDEIMWNDYRWNISSYPACTGELRYADLTGEAEEEAAIEEQAVFAGETTEETEEQSETGEQTQPAEPDETPAQEAAQQQPDAEDAAEPAAEEETEQAQPEHSEG